MHRVNYEGGLGILDKEKKLTIGYADAAASDELCAALAGDGDYGKFCREYTKVYNGNIERTKNNLWRFVVEMKEGDVVVVPCPWGFYICKIAGSAVKRDRDGLDLGWERDVELIGDVRSPRESYARAGLLSRMKCRQTTLCIDDLRDDVVLACTCEPLDLVRDMTTPLLDALRRQGRPEGLEEYVATVFESMGAEVEILPKNYAGKKGDCDVEATFTTLCLVVSVQCKKHEGTTDDWGVKQIEEYSNSKREDQEPGWTYWKWVVSTADSFSDDARNMAAQKNIRLVNGSEFCRMLLGCGIK